MGKPTPRRVLGRSGSSSSTPSTYRDDPDAVSLHTTPDDYSYADPPSSSDTHKTGNEPDEELPSYTETSTSIFPAPDPSAPAPHPVRAETSYSDAERAATVSHLTDNYSVHQPGGTNGWRVYRGGKPAEQNKTTIRIDERLKDPEELYSYITEYLRMVPPHPCVRIHGSHKERRRDKDGKSRTEQVTDFDITMDLQRYLRPAGDARFWGAKVVDDVDKVHRGGWRKTRAEGYTQAVQLPEEEAHEVRDEEEGSSRRAPDLRQWCEEYCQSPAWLKIFRINRNVLGLREGVLKSSIDRLVRETDYLGHIHISFPIEERHVDIYSPHPINKWRISWVRWLFYLSFLWIITWPILFFVTRRWDVYNVNWLFSYVDTANGVVNEQQTTINYPIRYATISEKDWFERHRALMRRMVLMKHQGDCTNMALNVENEPQRPMGGLPSMGNGTLDSAAGMLQAGFNTWNAVSRGRMPTQGWGGDC